MKIKLFILADRLVKGLWAVSRKKYLNPFFKVDENSLQKQTLIIGNSITNETIYLLINKEYFFWRREAFRLKDCYGR